MKKYAVYSLISAFCIGIASAGCSSSADESVAPGAAGSPKLRVETRNTGAAEANYAHKAFLVSADAIADTRSGANAAALSAFSVAPGSYIVYLTAANELANLTFSGVDNTNAVAQSRIKIADMSTQIPELMVGRSGVVAVGQSDATANIELRRVVASLNVKVNGLEEVDFSNISLTVKEMYDQVSLDGALSRSGAQFASKTLVLTKNAEGKFVGNAIVMPTNAEASTISLTYTIDGRTYDSTPQGRIAANGKYDLVTTVEGGAVDPTIVDLSSVIVYAAWDSSVDLSDSIVLDPPAPSPKQWVGPTAMPISGSEAPGYDNFRASSDGGSGEWGESYWAYNLYDGSKADDSNYWCPADWDYIAPAWHLSLGGAKQGITIDYWNKTGGKGGQKIKTMDIYGSNDAADYQGDNTGWIKITTFTSDKVTPTVDAGAQVTTGKLPFSADGRVSYKYVKCVITSKVDPSGNTVTGMLDVNVGELEISTWEYK